MVSGNLPQRMNGSATRRSNENGANDNENDVEQKPNQYRNECDRNENQRPPEEFGGGQLWSHRLLAMQANTSTLVARKRVAFRGICRPLRVRGTTENGRKDTMFLCTEEWGMAVAEPEGTAAD